MRVLDRTKETATPLSQFSYQLAAIENYNRFPDGVDEIAVIGVDSAANHFKATGAVAAGIFTIQELIYSSSGDSIPLWADETITILSTELSELQQRVQGVTGIVVDGQSRGSQWGADPSGNTHIIPGFDFDDPDITQWVDPASFAHTVQGVELGMHLAPAVGRQYSSDYPTGDGINNVNVFNHYAKDLKRRGHTKICGLIGAHGVTDYTSSGGAWGAGTGFAHLNSVAKAIDFLDASEHHYIFHRIMFIGETAADNAVAQATFTAAAIAEDDAWRAAVEAGTTRDVDLSRMVTTFVGLNGDFLATGGTEAADIEAGLADIATQSNYRSYMDTSAWSTAKDGVHDDAATSRRTGKELYASRLAGAQNYPETGLLLYQTTPAEMEFFTETVPSPYPAMDSQGGDIFHIRDTDITYGTGNQVATWGEYFGGNVATANGNNGAADITHSPGGGIDFAGTGNFRKLRLDAIIDGIVAAGSGTFIIDYEATGGFLLFAGAWQINLNNGEIFVMFPDSEKYVAIGDDLADGVRKKLAITIDSSNLDIYKDTSVIHAAADPTLADPDSRVDIGGSNFGGMLDGTIHNIYWDIGGGRKNLAQLAALYADMPV